MLKRCLRVMQNQGVPSVDLKSYRYTWHARTLPIYFVGTPAILAIASTLPEGLSLPLAGASSVVLVPLSYFLSQVSADAGKRLEAELWMSWGGPPTTRFLRRDNNEFNAETRTRVHAALRKLGLKLPTEAEEDSEQDRALELYASAVDELRRLTRDTARFPLVFQGNVEYGFRRNLLGLKTIGVSVAIVSLVTSGWSAWHGWNTLGVLPPVPTVTVVLIACVIVGWLLRVRPEAVRLTADRYARYLLEAACDLEPK